jgi:hypothetical protein
MSRRQRFKYAELVQASQTLKAVQAGLAYNLEEYDINSVSRGTGIPVADLTRYYSSGFSTIPLYRLVRLLEYICGSWRRFYLVSPLYSGYVTDEASWQELETLYSQPKNGGMGLLWNSLEVHIPSIEVPAFATNLSDGTLFKGYKPMEGGYKLQDFVNKGSAVL